MLRPRQPHFLNGREHVFARRGIEKQDMVRKYGMEKLIPLSRNSVSSLRTGAARFLCLCVLDKVITRSDPVSAIFPHTPKVVTTSKRKGVGAITTKSEQIVVNRKRTTQKAHKKYREARVIA
jgi:hypothetical protein